MADILKNRHNFLCGLRLCDLEDCTLYLVTNVSQNNCIYVLMPKNLTYHIQSFKWKSKTKLRFESWYADQVTKQIEKGTNIYSVNIETKLSVIKPLHARWLISCYDHMLNSREMIIKAFQMAGITPTAKIEIPDEDPFKDIWLT